MGLLEELRREMEGDSQEKAPMSQEEAVALGEKLRTLRAAYEAKETFSPGDLVSWKPGLKDKTVPAYGEVGIVMQVLPGEVDAKEESASPYFRQPIDLAVGLIFRDGDFNIFRFDAARMQKVEQTPRQ